MVLSSTIQLAKRIETHFIWIAKDMDNTYGPEVMGLVDLIAPDNKTLVDTAHQERPDIPVLVQRKAKQMKPDAIYIISNPELTRTVWQACKGQGIKCFGPIWDS